MEKKKYEWDINSGYDLPNKINVNNKEEKEENKGWQNDKYSKQLFTYMEKRKQWHLIEKCPECGNSTIFKFCDISSTPPNFLLTCLSRPDWKKVEELRKIHGKDTEEYHKAVSELYCGITFRID
jgi:hypothetical protein